MGVNTDYLGRVNVVPGLNQVEYDYLRAFAYSRRCFRTAGPYAVVPAHPDYGRGDSATKLHNEVAAGQPGYWCQWTPCPHGCCLGWNGHEKFYAGPAWMEYLIDHFLRPGAHAATSGDPQFAEFTFNHRLDGLLVGEQGDNRELFAIQVEDNTVSQLILRRGEPLPFKPGWDGLYLEDRPWLAREARPPRRRSSDDPWPELFEPTAPVVALPSPEPKRRRRKPDVSLG